MLLRTTVINIYHAQPIVSIATDSWQFFDQNCWNFINIDIDLKGRDTAAALQSDARSNANSVTVRSLDAQDYDAEERGERISGLALEEALAPEGNNDQYAQSDEIASGQAVITELYIGDYFRDYFRKKWRAYHGSGQGR